MIGSYRVGDRVESFTVTTDEGWRCRATRLDGDVVDVALGQAWRLEASYDGWEVRGGTVGPECLWVRGETAHSAVAVGFTGTSPVYDVALARVLALEVGASRRVRLVELREPVGAALTVDRTWTRTPCEEPEVARYEVGDLATGERWVLHLTDDVLVSREGRDDAVLHTLV